MHFHGRWQNQKSLFKGIYILFWNDAGCWIYHAPRQPFMFCIHDQGDKMGWDLIGNVFAAPHAKAHDRVPQLASTSTWTMIMLLFSTFSFFGLPDNVLKLLLVPWAFNFSRCAVQLSESEYLYHSEARRGPLFRFEHFEKSHGRD